jgi:hypothetical protein
LSSPKLHSSAILAASPWSSEEHLQHTLGGIDSTLRVLALREEPGGEQELAELQRLVQEALAALPEEEHRLERLAAAPAAELPGLVQALHAGCSPQPQPPTRRPSVLGAL